MYIAWGTWNRGGWCCRLNTRYEHINMGPRPLECCKNQIFSLLSLPLTMRVAVVVVLSERARTRTKQSQKKLLGVPDPPRGVA
jgi:hypothetical protein